MQAPCFGMQLVSAHPILDFGLSQTQDVLDGVGRGLAAAYMQEVQAFGGLIQVFLIACGVTQLTTSELLQQSGSFGIILLLADDLLHRTNLLSGWGLTLMIIQQIVSKSSVKEEEPILFIKYWWIEKERQGLCGTVYVHDAQ